MLKWIAPAVLSLSVLGALAAPAQAQRYDRNYDYNDRYYDYNDRYYDSRDYRDYRGNRGDQARRLSNLTNRINRLYSEGRLSRVHRDRALDKLQRVRDDVRSGHLSDSRFRANNDYMDGISQDVDNWSRADSGRDWDNRHYRRDHSWPF